MYKTESPCCTAEINNIVNQLRFKKQSKNSTLHFIVELYCALSGCFLRPSVKPRDPLREKAMDGEENSRE